MRTCEWGKHLDETPPSKTTIASILKKELGMSYKVLQTKNTKVTKPEQERLFCESLAVQLWLRDAGFELKYVDEFSFSSRK